MNINAPTKEPVAATMRPITSGVMIPARLAAKLNMPPVRPSKPFGAMSETSVQPSAAMPCAKNASDRIPITM